MFCLVSSRVYFPEVSLRCFVSFHLIYSMFRFLAGSVHQVFANCILRSRNASWTLPAFYSMHRVTDYYYLIEHWYIVIVFVIASLSSFYFHIICYCLFQFLITLTPDNAILHVFIVCNLPEQQESTKQCYYSKPKQRTES